jgi:exodeoxyribonuclease V gamma subunit
VLRPLDGARGQLAALLGLYREGLHRPVHFFPKSAWRYMTRGKRISEAIAAWRSSRFNIYAEELDPAYGLALRGVGDPLDGEFVACAMTVFQPLLDTVEDDRLPKASA